MDEPQNNIERTTDQVPKGGESIQSETTQASTSKNQEMETHFHGHMEFKKRWQEYIFQFLMLFTAVFLGFLAENAREHSAERKTEKDYILSLMSDLKSDTSTARSSASNIYDQIENLDLLQRLLSSHPGKGSPDITSCYELSIAIQQYFPVSFSERTISQLLSSGSMRLLKTDKAADSIMDYYSFIKSISEQRQLYYNYINKCMESMYNVYDASLMQTRLTENKDSLKSIFTYADHFATDDPNEFKKMIGLIERAKVTAFIFHNYVMTVYNKAIELYEYLQKTYKTEPK